MRSSFPGTSRTIPSAATPTAAAPAVRACVLPLPRRLLYCAGDHRCMDGGRQPPSGVRGGVPHRSRRQGIRRVVTLYQYSLKHLRNRRSRTSFFPPRHQKHRCSGRRHGHVPHPGGRSADAARPADAGGGRILWQILRQQGPPRCTRRRYRGSLLVGL